MFHGQNIFFRNKNFSLAYISRQPLFLFFISIPTWHFSENWRSFSGGVIIISIGCCACCMHLILSSGRIPYLPTKAHRPWRIVWKPMTNPFWRRSPRSDLSRFPTTRYSRSILRCPRLSLSLSLITCVCACERCVQIEHWPFPGNDGWDAMFCDGFAWMWNGIGWVKLLHSGWMV